jgi:uncharacterized protein YbjT (DUF2867 family)
MINTKTQTTLVLGGTGKTSRRVAQRLSALGREPRDFAVYARDAGAGGVWDVPAANGADQ